MENNPYVLPDLPYGYDALGQYISKDIMYLHHAKHHQTYVDKLNAVITASPILGTTNLVDLLSNVNELDESIKTPIINFGGGHYNHMLFWDSMSPDGGGEPHGELAKQLIAKYGSFQAFVDEFSSKSLGVFGSGWTWLLDDLSITTTPNQANPIMQGSNPPLMGLDVWEHAYYLDYKNKRDDYIKAWWNVVNWNLAEEKYSKQKSSSNQG